MWHADEEEAVAINVKLNFVIRNRIDYSCSVITDSESVLRALSNEGRHVFFHPFVADVADKITELRADGHGASFLW